MRDREDKPADFEEMKRKEFAKHEPKRRRRPGRRGSNFTPPKKKRKKRG